MVSEIKKIAICAMTKTVHEITGCATCSWPINKGENCLFRFINVPGLKEQIDVYCCQKCYDDPTPKYEDQVVS